MNPSQNLGRSTEKPVTSMLSTEDSEIPTYQKHLIMKKLLLFLLTAITSLSAFAQEFEYTYEGQTLKYEVVDEEAKTCSTSQTTYGVVGDLIIPSVAVYGDTEYEVISIGYYAFRECAGLTSVTIPNSVTSIKYGAFFKCTGLTSVTIPNSVTRISDNAFNGCSGLTSVTIPNSVTTIGDLAFSGCNNLIELFFNAENCEKIGEQAFPSSLQKVTFGDNVNTIPNSAFRGCSGLTLVTIPNSVTTIGQGAFEYCSGLTSVTIPNSVTTIGNFAFEGCKGLTSVTIPNSVTTIGESAFNGCSGLTSVTIPNSVTTIGESAFHECSSLTSVTIPNSVTTIGAGAFMGSNLKNVDFQSPAIWSQITFAGWGANPIEYAKTFSVNGTEVKHLDLDISKSDVSDYAFECAQNLNTIRIHAQSIGVYSFDYCSNVTDICLDVKYLAKATFLNCSNLKAIYSMTQEPPVAPDEAFSNYEGVTLYVPVGARSKYENAQNCWWRFLDIIETDFEGIDEIFKADYIDNENPDKVESIFADHSNSVIDFSAPLDVYTLNGVKIANTTDNLTPGIYIIRQGNATKKIAIN